MSPAIQGRWRGVSPGAPGSGDDIEFFKMAGGGNDFVVFDNRGGAFPREDTSLIRRLCTRRLSVGADGILFVEKSSKASFKLVYVNADGSVADFCANGSRCAARFAFLHVIAGRQMTIETGFSVLEAEVLSDMVRLDLPAPTQWTSPRPLPVAYGKSVNGHFVVAGVPHYVVYLREQLWEFDIGNLGRELRHHPDLAPAGANINFVVVTGKQTLDIRTYERGVEAETLACGSGTIAAATLSHHLGKVHPPVICTPKSGIPLTVDFEPLPLGKLRRVSLTGDARVIYRATLSKEATGGFVLREDETASAAPHPASVRVPGGARPLDASHSD